MSFVVDGGEWKLDNIDSILEFVSAIESLVDLVATARERGEEVWIGDDLQSRPIIDGYDLWALRGLKLGIAEEFWQELAAWLSQAQFYLDVEAWPQGFEHQDISIDGDPAIENADLAWVHHSVRGGTAMACLGLQRGGVHDTRSELGMAPVRWVIHEQDQMEFWRCEIARNDGAQIIERLAPHAYPDLYFREGVWRGLGEFAGGYRAVSSAVRRALSVLNDHGRWIFTTPPPALRPDEVVASVGERATNLVIEQRFSSYGLDVAPEALEVFQSGRCRRAREIELGGRTLYCEWHEKLERHQNRIYFHGPVQESKDRIVIGFFSRHLPLPGN
jgi:hypothetical protein